MTLNSLDFVLYIQPLGTKLIANMFFERDWGNEEKIANELGQANTIKIGENG